MWLWSPQICTEKPLWEWIYEITQKFHHYCLVLIINFYNFSYIFTLHHCSAVCWDLISRLICLDMCIIFLFVSVIVLFVYHLSIWNCSNIWKGAFCENYLRISVAVFCNKWFCLGCFSSPRSTSSFIFFSVNNVMICSEESFC